MKVRVIDDYLPTPIFEDFVQLIESQSFQWEYHSTSVYSDDKYPQLSHTFFDIQSFGPESIHYTKIHNVLNEIDDLEALARIKVNGTFKGQSVKEKPFHLDVESCPHLNSLILHLNTNDGYTAIKDENGKKHRIKSKANRAILFPNRYYHAGTNCTDKDLRLVLNIVYA
tara:strand:+ start:43 stop:549 length:507 start_codon:yes stop_codon:yes gene_type:complete